MRIAFIIAAATLPHGGAALAQSQATDCLFEVGSSRYIDGPCEMKPIQHSGKVAGFRLVQYSAGRIQYSAQVFVAAGAQPLATWNGPTTVDSSSVPLGRVTPKGACWESASARICAWKMGQARPPALARGQTPHAQLPNTTAPVGSNTASLLPPPEIVVGAVVASPGAIDPGSSHSRLKGRRYAELAAGYGDRVFTLFEGAQLLYAAVACGVVDDSRARSVVDVAAAELVSNAVISAARLHELMLIAKEVGLSEAPAYCASFWPGAVGIIHQVLEAGMRTEPLPNDFENRSVADQVQLFSEKIEALKAGAGDFRFLAALNLVQTESGDTVLPGIMPMNMGSEVRQGLAR